MRSCNMESKKINLCIEYFLFDICPFYTSLYFNDYNYKQVLNKSI